MKIATVRLIQADIPVERPHKMSFTTLEAVNFVFVRLETPDGLVGWGEAACLGGPTWSEESSESIAATIERYIVPWLVGRRVRDRSPVARDGPPGQGNPAARAAVEMALGSQRANSGVPCTACSAAACADRVPLSWSLAVADDAEIEEARAKSRRIFKIKTAARPVARIIERVRRLRSARSGVSLRVDANQGWDRPRLRRAIGLSRPMAWISSSSQFRAGTSRAWRDRPAHNCCPSWPTNRASRPRTR
jgi:muconate cycloisomerase